MLPIKAKSLKILSYRFVRELQGIYRNFLANLQRNQIPRKFATELQRVPCTSLANPYTLNQKPYTPNHKVWGLRLVEIYLHVINL